MQAQALRAKRRNRSRLITLGLMILPLLALILGLWWRYGQEHESYYAAFERVNGWPKGVGKPLTKEERNKNGELVDDFKEWCDAYSESEARREFESRYRHSSSTKISMIVEERR